MSQTSVKNMKIAPMRMSELLPQILAMKQQQEDEMDGSCSSSPDGYYSDSDIVEHNRGFYKSVHKTDITYPKSYTSVKETDSNQYNQTYPNRDTQNSASKSKYGKSETATPIRTPRKTSSIKSHKLKTPRSSAKKKTPRMFKSSGKKDTFRKCLNLEDVFKSSTKCSLFSSGKSQLAVPRHDLTEESDSKSKALVPLKPTTLDEVFASCLHITDDSKDNHAGTAGHPSDKTNPFYNKFNTIKPHEKFATPKSSNISSNLILKGCRENVFITPHKPLELSGIHKHETPSTQNKIVPYINQTPLLPIKERGTPSYQQSSSKKNINSVRKDKENEMVDRIEMQRKDLFTKSKENMSIVNKIPPVLKEIQMNDREPKRIPNATNLQKPGPITKEHENYKITTDNIVHKHVETQKENENILKNNCDGNKQESKTLADSQHRCVSPNKPKAVIQTPQKDQIVKTATQQKERTEPLKEPNREYPRPSSIFPPKQNQDAFLQYSGQHNPVDRVSDLDRPLVNRIAESKPTPQRISADSNLRPPQTLLPKQFKILTMKGKQYTVLGKIGSGGSSEVFKVMDPEDTSMYAVKCVNLAVDQHIAQGYVNEINLLQRLQGSDRVITMYNYEYVEKQRKLYVLLEMGDVDLSSLMKGYRARESRLPLPILVCYWTEMLSAVHHIHQHGIIHSDLKPANFLLVHGRLKLIDFGIASSLSADATSVYKNSTEGTFNYISPEAVNIGTGRQEPIKITYKSDVWSLGCILYSMLYGRTPFSHVTHVLAKVAALSNPNQAISYPELEGVPPIIMKALRWCLVHDVKQRPSVQQLMDLPYIGRAAPRRVPPPIMAKIKAALTEQEWKQVIEELDAK